MGVMPAKQTIALMVVARLRIVGVRSSSQRGLAMKKALSRIILSGVFVTGMTFGMAGVASAKNTSSCDFYQGTTTCTTTHGSHGSTDEHHGQIDSNGLDLGGGPCKATGSTQTDTC